jgi:hypothetical protein
MALPDFLSPLTYLADGTLALVSSRARARIVASGGERRLIASIVFGLVGWTAVLVVAFVALGRRLGLG